MIGGTRASTWAGLLLAVLVPALLFGGPHVAADAPQVADVASLQAQVTHHFVMAQRLRHELQLERVRTHRRVVRLRHSILKRPDVDEAIRLAARTYHVDLGQMRRVAGCETGGTFNPRSSNRKSHADGLFQFLPSTWDNTPYADFSPYSAYANALAAAHLVKFDGWHQWDCQP